MSETKEDNQIYGLLAEFEYANQLVEATARVKKDGYNDIECYSPFPVEELHEPLGFHVSRLPKLVFIGGLLGGLAGFFMQYFASVIDYPYNVGGRPFNSWPSFIPITFELTILGAAFSAVFGMLALNGLPLPYHPVFNVEKFKRASKDRFFLCVKATDKKFNLEETKAYLATLDAEDVHEVEP